MKQTHRFLKLIVLFALTLGICFAAAAQGTNAPPVLTPGTPAVTAVPWASLMIPVLVPIVLAVLKAFLPKLPSAVFPILAPLLGAGIDIIQYYVGLPTVSTLTASMLGLAGVGLREIQDQAKKSITNAPPKPTQ